MKSFRPLCSLGFFLLCACTMFEAKKTPTPMLPPKPLAVPVGKNWQVIEEAPKVRDERDHVPFQTEQSLQPEGATTPTTPEENRRLQTPR